MTRRYLEGDLESGTGEETVSPGPYDFEVVDSRTIDNNEKLIFADLKIVGGPEDGKVVSVSIYIPDDDDTRGARFHFSRKTGAFLAAKLAMREASDDEQVQTFADSIIGVKGRCELTKQKDGEYKGRQELVSTRALDARAESPAAPADDPGETQDVPETAPAAAEDDGPPPF